MIQAAFSLILVLGGTLLAPGNCDCCGCDSCDHHALAVMADGHTCGSRIWYLQEEHHFAEYDACLLVANVEFPDECAPCDPIRCNTPKCGCPTCTDEVLSRHATDDHGTFSCGDRIDWLVENGGFSNEIDACVEVANIEFPEICGQACDPLNCPPKCGCPTCTAEVLQRQATDDHGTFSCGDRINWLLMTGVYTDENDACTLVSNTEFPDICGPCDPLTCQVESFAPSSNPTISARPSTVPSDSPSKVLVMN
mmetsp:Transcript_22741/g.25893  ORF Transcript_22741/g.25893 Transcript_22741/m.25893 type:complete len:252 (+) Transcript_22741:189-944(+)